MVPRRGLEVGDLPPGNGVVDEPRAVSAGVLARRCLWAGPRAAGCPYNPRNAVTIVRDVPWRPKDRQRNECSTEVQADAWSKKTSAGATTPLCTKDSAATASSMTFDRPRRPARKPLCCGAQIYHARCCKGKSKAHAKLLEPAFLN